LPALNRLNPTLARNSPCTWAMEVVRFYRPRNPKGTPLWKLSETLYDRLRGEWEERFEAKFGFWRGLADEAVARYLDCGLPEFGFARLKCDGCRVERLLTFSCRTRQMCPSCGAKRGAIFGAFLREEVVEDVGHCQWVFTIPKIIRPYFLRNRELLGDLSRAAWETVLELMTEAAGDLSLRPGMVIVPQSFGSSVNFHPHIHSIVSRGGWTPTGDWIPIPYVDVDAAARLFRHKVLKFLRTADLLDEERTKLILAWAHNSGFSVHNSVVVQADDGEGLERLARYLARPPVSLERMEWDRARGEVIYRTARGHAEGRENRADGEERAGDFERLDELEFLARASDATARAAKAFHPVLRVLRGGGESEAAAGGGRWRGSERNEDRGNGDDERRRTNGRRSSRRQRARYRRAQRLAKKMGATHSQGLRSGPSRVPVRRHVPDCLRHHRAESHRQDSGAPGKDGGRIRDGWLGGRTSLAPPPRSGPRANRRLTPSHTNPKR